MSVSPNEQLVSLDNALTGVMLTVHVSKHVIKQLVSLHNALTGVMLPVHVITFEPGIFEQ